MKQRIAGNENRQIPTVYAVEQGSKTWFQQAFTHHEAVLLENCQFLRIEPKVNSTPNSVIITVRHRKIEFVPELCGSWVPINSRKILRVAGISNVNWKKNA